MSSIESFLQTYGLLAIVIGTFFEGETILVIAGLAAHRGYLSLPAVIAAGGLVWSIAVGGLGYGVGEGAEAALGRVKEIEAWLFLAVAASGLIVWLIYFLRSRTPKEERPGADRGGGDELR